MKKIYWLCFGLLTTFIFGVSASRFYLKYNQPVYTFEEVISSGAPKTEYCDLVSSPSKYDGKIVRVRANLNWFTHGLYLDDSNCFGEGDNAKTAIVFNERVREKLFEAMKQKQIFGKPRRPLEIIAVGVFKYKSPRGVISDSIEDRTPLHFEIYNIEYSAG